MDAIVQDKAVVERWADYRKASDHACRAYREIYRRAYDTIREEVEESVATIRGGEAYARAPDEHRDRVVDAVFGPGRVCHYAQVEVGSAGQLIEAAGRRSLTILDQARVALPGYCAQVEAELRGLAAPPDPDERVFEWRTSYDLTGHRFATEPEVDEAFAQATKKLQRSAEELKAPHPGRLHGGGQMTGDAQALSDRHKEAVRSWAPRVRKTLEEDFAAQLERLGMQPNGRHTPLDTMRLPDETKAIRRRVEALLAREVKAEGSAERGFDNVLRELTYTLLNRLVGLKAMEARGLLFLPPPGVTDAPPEPTEVIGPVPGQPRSRYLRDFRAASGRRYKYADDADTALLRDALTAAFRHVTRDIRVLFDPDHECACIWPTHDALVEVVRLINEGLPDGACRAPDFLGWVYQFFNREEKKRIRDENQGTPRSSYELAVINQFYTPAWIVKALVDNTLGRLWLQMHPRLVPAGQRTAAAARRAQPPIRRWRTTSSRAPGRGSPSSASQRPAMSKPGNAPATSR